MRKLDKELDFELVCACHYLGLNLELLVGNIT